MINMQRSEGTEHTANQTSRTSVCFSFSTYSLSSVFKFCVPEPVMSIDSLVGNSPVLSSRSSPSARSSDACSPATAVVAVTVPSFASTLLGRFHRLILNFARRSSSETACRTVRTIVFEVVNESRSGMIPTESAVSLMVQVSIEHPKWYL